MKSYNQFANSLETRVLVTARSLDALDETKVVPEPSTIEEQPRQLTAPELADELAASAHPVDALAARE